MKRVKLAQTQRPKRDLRRLDEGVLVAVVGGLMPDGHGHGKGGPDPGGGGGKSL